MSRKLSYIEASSPQELETKMILLERVTSLQFQVFSITQIGTKIYAWFYSKDFINANAIANEQYKKFIKEQKK